MPTDAQICHSAQKMMRAIDIPDVPMASIQARIERRRAGAARTTARPRRLAVAAALVLVALPVAAYSIVGYEARSRAALQEHGGWAPPAPPAAFVEKLRPKVVTIAEARKRAGFPLVAPLGLPRGTALTRIQVGAVGIYDTATKRWRTGGSEVVFEYRRSDGRLFRVSAQRYDLNEVPGRYLFEDRGPDAHGNPILIRRENYSWRNGDQMTTVTAGDAIGAREIVTMARSMRGTILSLPWPEPHRQGEMRIIAP